MNQNEAEIKATELLEDISTVKVTSPEQTLAGDLALDSLRMVMLLVLMEDTLDIELDEADMNPLALITVKDVIELVKKYDAPQEEVPEKETPQEETPQDAAQTEAVAQEIPKEEAPKKEAEHE